MGSAFAKEYSLTVCCYCYCYGDALETFGQLASFRVIRFDNQKQLLLLLLVSVCLSGKLAFLPVQCCKLGRNHWLVALSCLPLFGVCLCCHGLVRQRVRFKP